MEQVGVEDRSVAIPLVLIPQNSADPTTRNPGILCPSPECSLGRSTQQSNQDCNEFVIVGDTPDAFDELDNNATCAGNNANQSDTGSDDDDDDIDHVEADDGTEEHQIPNDEPQGWLLINPRYQLPLVPGRSHTNRLLFVHGIVRDFHGHHTTHNFTPPFRSGLQTPDSMYPEPSTSGQPGSPESSMVLNPLCANQVSLLLHMGQHFTDGPLRMTPPSRLPHALDFSLEGLAGSADMEENT